MKLSDIRIRPKLIFFSILTGILPLAVVGYLGINLAKTSLLEEYIDRLVTVQALHMVQVERAFEEKKRDLVGMAKSEHLQRMLNELNAYSEQIGILSGGSFDVTSAQYKEFTDTHRDFFVEFTERNDVHDIILISGDSGQVMFSAKAEEDLGTNLATGRYQASGLSRLWQEVMKTKQSYMVDFMPYEPNEQMEAAFIGVPIFGVHGEVDAVIAVQLSSKFIVDTLDSRRGMGHTGESYIIKWDKESTRFEFRSNMETMGFGRYIVGASLDKRLDYWHDAVDADKDGGSGIYTDSAGNAVLIAFDKLDIEGFDWFIISKIDEQEVTVTLRNILKIGAAVAVALIVCIVTGSWFFANRFAKPVIEDAEFAKKIAQGEYDAVLQLNQKDELGELAGALNGMATNLREITWLKEGKEGLDDKLRGIQSSTLLVERFLSYFVDHLGAQIGAFYLFKEGQLTLNSSYSFIDRDGNFNSFGLGEGMVGQAASEMRTIYFSKMGEGEVPAANYGVGEEKPNYFMISPLMLEGDLLGVVLVGSLTPFNELERSFVDQNLANFAVLFSGTESREMIQELLDKSQEQQKELHLMNEELEIQTKELQESQSELQAQQEELRVTNEELEEQTKALKESEKELQSQQEELRVTNEELEARTKALEQQKQAMNKKTRELAITKRDVERKAKDLEVASKYKSEFLANMSHELRTPLNSILILSELLAKNQDGNLAERQVESSKAIHKSGADLLALINEILDLSKVEAGKVELLIEETSLDMITNDINRVFKDVTKEKGIGFSILSDDDIPAQIFTDSQRVQQVLRNLLTNAVKFTHEGEVSLTISRPKKEYLAQTGLKTDESISFAVKDDGIGIPEKQQAEIFEAFKQADGSTSRTYGGTGLGLSISKELVRLLGGSIHLESEEGKGAMFTVVLPVMHQSVKEKKSGAEKLAEQQDKKRESETPVKKKSVAPVPGKEDEPEKIEPAEGHVHDDRKKLSPGDKSLLIIEDDQQFVEILRDFGHERGFKCIVAENGETGLHFADFYKPSAVILDIGLPGIDGWQVMERLKENPDTRHIPVHFMSASDASLDAMRMGAIGFLGKPVSIEKVEEAFGKIETIISKPVRKLLVVEDDEIQQESIKQLIGGGDVETTMVGTGEEAFSLLNKGDFDCLVLDLGLNDMTGFELLEKIRDSKECASVPVIIYTGRDLTSAQEHELRKYTDSIIIKGVKSPERLLEESALFLHRVEADLPKEQKRKKKMQHNKEAVFTDKQVLLVDDDMRNVFALSAVLEEKGLDIVIARNGLDALEKLKENDGISLVLMDIMMPKMDGYEAMREIRKEQKYHRLPIIALTAKAMKGDRAKCIEAGANDYMAKPVNTDKLLSMLRVWLY